jgi:hypothetical protein
MEMDKSEDSIGSLPMSEQLILQAVAEVKSATGRHGGDL